MLEPEADRPVGRCEREDEDGGGADGPRRSRAEPQTRDTVAKSAARGERHDGQNGDEPPLPVQPGEGELEHDCQDEGQEQQLARTAAPGEEHEAGAGGQRHRPPETRGERLGHVPPQVAPR